jgi:hypothetical protein
VDVLKAFNIKKPHLSSHANKLTCTQTDGCCLAKPGILFHRMECDMNTSINSTGRRSIQIIEIGLLENKRYYNKRMPQLNEGK